VPAAFNFLACIIINFLLRARTSTCIDINRGTSTEMRLLLVGLAGVLTTVLGVSFGQTTWGGGGVTIGCDPLGGGPDMANWYQNIHGMGDTPGTCEASCRTDAGQLLSSSAKAQGYKFM
jgi:hypothetical protein